MIPVAPLPFLITPLPWDSAFLGLPVGRLTAVDPTVERAEIEAAGRRLGLRLLYWEPPVAPSDHDQPPFRAAQGLIPLVHRVCFAGDVLTPAPPWPADVHLASAPTDTLRRLALQSGEYSRFRLDPHLPAGTFERLYGTWLDNSFGGRGLARAVLVVQPAGAPEPVGLLTLGQQPDGTDIGLLAVDETARGAGLGRQLLNAAHHLTAQWGYHRLTVATQLENQAGCRFYERAGFRLADVFHTYHLWL